MTKWTFWNKKQLQAIPCRWWKTSLRDGQHTRETPHLYWPVRDELHIIEGLLFRGETLVIPRSMRHEFLTKLHESHLGIDVKQVHAPWCTGLEWGETSRKQYQGASYVPNTNKPANSCESLIPHVIQERPWSKLGTDIFTLRGRDYLLVVDYFSK